VQRDLVVQALAALSLEQRTCLLLQVWVGLSAAQISAMLGKSESAIKMTLMRARRQFRAAYGAESDEAMSEDQV
jgi:DNA-directed RNA polymerase specialized sigma24 family protein